MNTTAKAGNMQGAGGIIPMIDIHRRLRIAREIYSSRISQDDFGSLIGMSGNTVGNYETGATTRLKDIYIQKWAEVTGVDYWWIKTGHATNENDPHTCDTCGGRTEPPVGLEPTTCALQGGTFSPIIDIFTGREAA
ncbi:MAG: helix-turn-helix transcriptional regulator [Hyphomicrobium sp.]|jgi:transcriptional regulator with XRE-family HTH domain